IGRGCMLRAWKSICGWSRWNGCVNMALATCTACPCHRLEYCRCRSDMMKLLIIVVLFIVGAVQAQTPPPKIQTTPVYITTGKDNYLVSDITTTTEFPTMPTHCGGTLHEGVLSAGLA